MSSQSVPILSGYEDDQLIGRLHVPEEIANAWTNNPDSFGISFSYVVHPTTLERTLLAVRVVPLPVLKGDGND